MRTTRWILAPILGILAVAMAPSTAAAAKNDPVLLVHGWRGSPSTWAEMIDRFRLAGRQAEAIRLPGQDNIKNAQAIRDFISNKGWDDVDIVAQSMGGLSARYFIKTIGTSRVDTYVSLGTPQYGLLRACLMFSSQGGQMCPSRSFLRSLNTGDDTPTDVYWTTIYSRTDGVVANNSSRLDGGACHLFEDPGVRHNDMDDNNKIFAHVLDATNRTCDRTFKTT